VREKIEERLAELRAEFETGQKLLADGEARQAHLRSSLLRISGAIMALEELLTPQPGENGLSRGTAAAEYVLAE